MADGGFRGTTLDQDSRFADKQKKLLKSMRFPSNFAQKVDLSKVNLTVIKPWIHKRVIELLGIEDELLINYIFEMLEDPKKKIDPKDLQISLTEFLAKDTPAFVSSLWDLLLSAQENIGGIPKVFLEEKMKEVAKLEEEKKRMADEIRKRVLASSSTVSGAVSGVVNPDRERQIDGGRDGDRDGDRERDGGRRSNSRWDDRRDDRRDVSRRDDNSRRDDYRRNDYRRDDYSRRDDYRRDRGDYNNRDRDRDSYSIRGGGGGSGDRDDGKRDARTTKRDAEPRIDDYGRDRDYARRDDRGRDRDRDRSVRRWGDGDDKDDKRSSSDHRSSNKRDLEDSPPRRSSSKRERVVGEGSDSEVVKEGKHANETEEERRERKRAKKAKKAHKHKKSKSSRHDDDDGDAGFGRDGSPSPSKDD
ncbi:UNVERIFIED_CONTAM: hypothetical protein HDU68_010315 [Siphonaria sp. JEL0065]|nr:hypothetical protein HDU68_010315 [Siphonaria sp. JEL0065]